MRERPILMAGDMVRACLEGRKSQTRRPLVAKDNIVLGPRQIRYGGQHRPFARLDSDRGRQTAALWCPFGVPGDRLWVRETWADSNPLYIDADGDMHRESQHQFMVRYRAVSTEYPNITWRPSIHMPRWASRLTLEITGVRVERLQDISGEDAKAEGIACARCDCEVCMRSSVMCPADASSHIEEYARLWDSLSAKRAPWSSNPWVWCLSFRRIESADTQKEAAHE